MKEIEAKILEIAPEQVVAKLESLGATLEFEEEFNAVYFDTPTRELKAESKALRLRREGPATVLTLKSPLPTPSHRVKTMQETETRVQDFAAMTEVLLQLGYEKVLEMSKVRRQYHLDGVHIVLDRYLPPLAHIPEFLEIEAPSEERLLEIAVRLGFSETDLCNWNSAQLIAHYAK